MMIYTHIEIPDYVYFHFTKDERKYFGRTPEEKMASYLIKHVKRIKTQEEISKLLHKQDNSDSF